MDHAQWLSSLHLSSQSNGSYSVLIPPLCGVFPREMESGDGVLLRDGFKSDPADVIGSIKIGRDLANTAWAQTVRFRLPRDWDEN